MGGAGIGDTLDPLLAVLPASAKITAYEPLPENAKVLRQRFGGIPAVDVREMAISDRNGTASFVVPTRVHAESGSWSSGTSYGGYLHRGWGLRSMLRRLRVLVMGMTRLVQKHDRYQTVHVKTVRLDSDLTATPDAIKLDLQGGEPAAMDGLGEKLRQVKMVKAEVQMLRGQEREQCVEKLHEAGFVIFPEGLQFSVPKLDDALREKLKAQGIQIKLELSGTDFDPQTMVVGDWVEDKVLPFDGLNLKPEFIALLAEAKARYFQIDLIALNRAHADSWKAILPSLKL